MTKPSPTAETMTKSHNVFLAILITLLLIALLLTTLFSQPALAKFNVKDCLNKSQTALEKTYCKIKEQGGGKQFPSLYELRKNPENIQALLLKRDAERLGIPLPSPSTTPSKDENTREVVKKTNSSTSTQHINTNRSEGSHTKKTTRQKKRPSNSQSGQKPKPPSYSKATRPTKNHAKQATLQNCAIEKHSIRCPNYQFYYVHNKSNKELNRSAFSESNQLQLPIFTGPMNDKKRVNSYVTEAYQVYIRKMLELGLGETTMTYTKFYYTFQHAAENDINFSGRFNTMYQFLKKDKQSMGIGRKKKPTMPKTLRLCELLTPHLIACHQGEKNLLFQAVN